MMQNTRAAARPARSIYQLNDSTTLASKSLSTSKKDLKKSQVASRILAKRLKKGSSMAPERRQLGMANILTPEEVDARWRLPRGRAQRLARKGTLPAAVFPDGTIRFNEQELVAHLKATVQAQRNDEDR